MNLTVEAHLEHAVGIDRHGWPYGPNTDPAARRRLLAWATRRELTLAAPRTECLHWLTRGRCAVRDCHGLRAQYGSWVDHVTCWNRHGRAHLIYAQPYSLGADAMAELAAIAGEWRVDVAVAPRGGWYGHGTVAVELTPCAAADEERRKPMRCVCGATMVATRYSNSGTTYISEACPVLAELWGPDPHVWRRASPPHQFVCQTTAVHAATGCCDHRDVLTYP